MIGGSSPSLGCCHRTSASTASDLTGAKVELRLVVEHEVALVDRLSQLLEEAHLVPVLVEVRLVDGEGRLAGLGPVHGDIGAPDEAGAVGGVGGRHGDADAGADAGADHVQHERFLEALGEPLCDRRGVVGVPVDEHDGELVTTDADEQIGVSQRGHEPGAEQLQELVAGRVPEGVVDLLEMVEVDEQERQMAFGRRRIVAVSKEVVENTEQVAAVAEPGQVVGDGLAVPLEAQLLKPSYRQDESDSDGEQRRGCEPDRDPADRSQRADEQHQEGGDGADLRKDEAR